MYASALNREDIDLVVPGCMCIACTKSGGYRFGGRTLNREGIDLVVPGCMCRLCTKSGGYRFGGRTPNREDIDLVVLAYHINHSKMLRRREGGRVRAPYPYS